MTSESQPLRVSRVFFWAGWIITILPVPLLVMSGVMKLLGAEPVAEGFKQFGYDMNLAVGIGIVELVCTALYLIPQTSVLGAILLVGYLGGATATHVRVGDSFFPPVILGVLVWLGLYLRDARLRALLPLRTRPASN